MTFEQAKARAYGAAFDAFFGTMRELVGEAGIAHLASSEPDEHLLIVGVADGSAITMHITVEYGPAQPLQGLDEIIDPPMPA